MQGDTKSTYDFPQSFAVPVLPISLETCSLTGWHAVDFIDSDIDRTTASAHFAFRFSPSPYLAVAQSARNGDRGTDRSTVSIRGAIGRLGCFLSEPMPWGRS